MPGWGKQGRYTPNNLIKSQIPNKNAVKVPSATAHLQEFDSRLLFVCPPELLFDFWWQRIEKVFLHHQPTPL